MPKNKTQKQDHGNLTLTLSLDLQLYIHNTIYRYLNHIYEILILRISK